MTTPTTAPKASVAQDRAGLIRRLLGGAGKAVGAVGQAAGKVLDSYEGGFKRVDMAKDAKIDDQIRSDGRWPGGLAEYSQLNAPQGNDVGNLASKLMGIYGRIKKKK